MVSGSAVPVSVSGPAVPLIVAARTAVGTASDASSATATNPRRAMVFDMWDTSDAFPAPPGLPPPSRSNL